MSAGGSLYLDLVVAALGRGPWRLVLRAGCYLAHDAGAYERAFEEMKGMGVRVVKVKTGSDPAHAPARRSYEKAGFNVRLEHVVYLREL